MRAIVEPPHQRLVKTIGPASSRSEMTEGFLVLREMRREIARRSPRGRIGRSAARNGAVVVRTAAAASDGTGQSCSVAGGRTA